MGPHPSMNWLTVPTQGGADGGRGSGGGVNVAGALRGTVPFRLASYADKHPAEAVASVPGFEVKDRFTTCIAPEEPR